MKNSLLFTLISLVLSFQGCAQSTSKQFQQRLIGTCEGCEAVFEYGTKNLTHSDTLPDFNLEGPQLKITGTIYKTDGITPAENVILYIYHTNQEGIYENRNNATNWERRHGYLRGWIRTGADGKYSFYTLKPGTYPDRSLSAHIHITLLEPDGKYYWIDEFHFAGDPLLTENELRNKNPRGGTSGLVHLKEQEGLWVVNRDLVLGKNVPGYQ